MSGAGAIGLILGWPNEPETEHEPQQWCGCGRIIAIIDGTNLALVDVIEGGERLDDEPPFMMMFDLLVKDLRFFPTLEAYHAWITYWRSQEDRGDREKQLEWMAAKGRA